MGDNIRSTGRPHCSLVFQDVWVWLTNQTHTDLQKITVELKRSCFEANSELEEFRDFFLWFLDSIM